jgi:hypothetical protein
MKRNLILSSLLGILCVTAAQTWAQSQVVGDDGIAASPKVRQMLNERNASIAASTTTAPAAYPTVATDDQLAASPKVRMMLNEQAKTPLLSPASEYVGYQPTGPDGIAASPKVRQMMDERPVTVEIAPLK